MTARDRQRSPRWPPASDRRRPALPARLDPEHRASRGPRRPRRPAGFQVARGQVPPSESRLDRAPQQQDLRVVFATVRLSSTAAAGLWVGVPAPSASVTDGGCSSSARTVGAGGNAAAHAGSVSAGTAADALGLRPRRIVTAGGPQKMWTRSRSRSPATRNAARPELLVALGGGGIVDAPVRPLGDPGNGGAAFFA